MAGADGTNHGAGGALDGIRVLDLSRVLAGPWATQVLGDLGADVIKIERPGRGDDTRAWGPPNVPGTDYSAYYASCNRSKRSVAIDFALPEGRELIVALARGADVLVENFKVGGAARHGFGYETLQAVNPRLIYCSITGFGQTGPYAPRAGYDAMMQGMGGLMSITGRTEGEPGSGPQKVGVATIDLSTGLYAVIAILAALLQRGRTGRGQYIDLALLDVSVALLANQGVSFLASGLTPKPPGNAHPSIVPYQDFPTRDGHFMLAIGNDRQFAEFCRCAGHPEWSADPRYATNPQRVAHRGELVPMVAQATRTRSTSEWVAALEHLGVPCGPINNIAEVFADPQVHARGLRVDIRSPGGLPIPGIASPLRLSAAPVRYELSPPALGAHTREVLEHALGLDDAHIRELCSRGVIHVAPGA